MPERSGRSPQLYSRRLSEVTLCQISWSGCKTSPVDIPGPSMWPVRYPHLKRWHGVVTPFPTCPFFLITLPQTKSSVVTLHLPPNLIFWGTMGLLHHTLGNPEIPPYSKIPRKIPSVACSSISKGCGRNEIPHRTPTGFPGMSLSKALYDFWRSRKIMYRTSSLKAASWWISLALR